MIIDRERAIQALAALGEQLDYIGGPPVELVICGGAALTVLGLVDRVTKDVDVLALADTDETGCIRIELARTLPDDVTRAAEIVARDLDLPSDWLDTRAGEAYTSLPCGLPQRLHTQPYGRRLAAHFVSRFDQICLKLVAVVDRDAESVHLADLRTMKPSDEEIAAAADWCLRQDAGESFPSLLTSCLRQIGYPDVAGSIEDGA